MQAYARDALTIAKENGMFLVLDADGLYMAGQDLSVIKGYRRAVLTPNVVEFKRLSEQAVRMSLALCGSVSASNAHYMCSTRVSIRQRSLKTAPRLYLGLWAV